MNASKFSGLFMAKSPIDKKLVGKQHRLPEELKQKILAAPEDGSAAKYNSPMTKIDPPGTKKDTINTTRRFIKNPKFDLLTEEDKKIGRKKSYDAGKVITYKGVQFDAEDGALVNMPNPNYKPKKK